MPAKWLVTVDRTLCVGSAVCVGTAPGRFELGGDNRSRPTPEAVDADEAVLDAVASCPAEAIAVVDAATGLPVDPDA
jgi:ferredoxin